MYVNKYSSKENYLNLLQGNLWKEVFLNDMIGNFYTNETLQYENYLIKICKI